MRISFVQRLTLLAAAFLISTTNGLTQTAPAWPQWGQNPQHSGNLPFAGQPPQTKLGDFIFDPFVAQETAEENGNLLMHYQVALVNGPNVYMEVKTGSYVSCDPPGSGKPFPCGPDAWNKEVWNERAWQWQDGKLVQRWNFVTDWLPLPNSGTSPATRTLEGWEPLFQPLLAGIYIYVPGADGTLYKLNQGTGAVAAHINPFGTLDPSKFVAGGLSADSHGNIYYNVIKVDPAWPWDEEPLNSWLVRVGANNIAKVVTYASLLPNAPKECSGIFSNSQLPWPPSANAVPPNVKCGLQRPALNLAPAISADGSTVYTVSRGHFWPRVTYLLALNTSNLSLQWSTSLQDLLSDGCNILLPPDGQPGGCSIYGATGVNPVQNLAGGAVVNDQESSSPVVAPDGSILIGANGDYNYGRGHLLQFSPKGQFLASYDFGWDTTPTIYPHNGTYSVILKDNHYNAGSYCNVPAFCPPAPRGPYYVTQLDSSLNIEWQFKDPSTNQSHPDGFEWCVNDAAVDVKGTVYATNEDGYLYVIPQGGTSAQRIFLTRSIDAGYTPISLGANGIIYAENGGHLIPIGKR